MDNNYVISVSYDLNELDREMEKWTNLPFDLRMRSNDECMRRYGCTNIDLYNRVKAYILKVKPLNVDLESVIQESSVVVDKDFFKGMEDYNDKVRYTRELNNSPYIALLDPSDLYTKDELNIAYMKYINLNDKDKRLSDSYSLCIWGYNVYNMFLIMNNSIETTIEKHSPDTIISKVATMESFVEDINNIRIMEDDKLGLLKFKLKMCDHNMPINESIELASLSAAVDKAYYNDNFNLPTIVPYYNNNEKSVIKYPGVEVTNENYGKLVQSAIKNYELDKTEANEKILEDLGIPSVLVDISKQKPMNLYGICRYRQQKYLEEFAPTIVDISNIPITESELIRESTQEMKDLYKSKNIYPVYIILSYTDTFFGHVIRKVKKSTYTHAAICLDSNLKRMITFKFDKSTGENGINIEDLDFYLKKSDESLISVMAVFVDKQSQANIRHALNYFIANKDKTRYGFGNLFNILLNRSVEYSPTNLSLVCSQFVDSILKMSKININADKSSNLVIPQDFQNIQHPKLYKLYEGLVKNYRERDIEAKIKQLIRTVGKRNMIYSDLVDTMNNESVNLLELFKSVEVTDNEAANDLLYEARELLTPTAVIVERKLPLTIKDDGTISISLYKSLEEEYQESHKIIQACNKDNLNTLKHEMARLFYLNSVLERKLNKMDKSSPNYKISIDLRARVINDFYKVSEIVFENDKRFDFNKYFKKSEYSNESLDIDYNVLKYSGKLIKDIFTKG